MELTSGITKVVIDEKNGSIVLLKNTKTGFVHINNRDDRQRNGGLFRLIIPGKQWSSRHADSQEQAAPQITTDGDVAILRYPQLLAGSENTGVSVEVRAWPDFDTGEIRFQMKVANNGGEDVTEIQGPLLHGWKGVGGIDKYRFMYSPFIDIKGRLPSVMAGTSYVRAHQRFSTPYPVGAMLPWMDLSGPGGGISYVNLAARPRNGVFFQENMAGYEPGLKLRFGWGHYGPVRPGEEWVSSTVGISVHDGDWRETADRYSRWVDTWFIPPPTPAALKRSIGYQNVIFKSFDGAPVRPLTDIPVVAAAGRRYGVNHLSVWDYMTLSKYAKHTDEELLDYSEQDCEIIRQGSRRAKADGTSCSALINFRLTVPSSRTWDEKELVKTYYGGHLHNNFAGSSYNADLWRSHMGSFCAWLSPFSPSCRKRMLQQTKEYINLGYNAMFFDQPFAGIPDYGHLDIGCKPEDTHAALMDIIREIRYMMHKNDPNAYMIGECCDPFMAQYIDMWMSWYSLGESALNVSYSVPQTTNSWVVANSLTRDIGGRMVTDALTQASFGFSAGLQLCLLLDGGEATLGDYPELGAHVKQLADLRQRTAERTTMARFRDNRGISVKGDGLLAYSFDSAAGPAVAVTAMGDGSHGKVSVDRKAFTAPGNPDSGRICHLDGGATDTRGDECEFILKPNETAVWLL